MSIPQYDVKQTYTGTGLVDEYSFDFKIASKSQLLVVVTDDDGAEVERVRGTDTDFLSDVTFDATDGGGTVTLQDPLTADYTIILLLANDEPTQDYEFRNKKSFTLRRFEDALDYILGAVQRLVYRGKQAIKIHDLDDEETFNTQLPPGIADQALRVFLVNEDGDGWEWGPTAGEIINAEGFAEDASADAAAAAASAAAAATSATNAATSATAAASSASAAATSAAAAATSATAAQTAETAAELAETNAETAETAAELAETNAETAQAAAAASAAAAAASETAAELAETNAETAETAAELAETNAETAEAAAEAAQAAAEAALAAMAEKVTGPASSTDNVLCRFDGVTGKLIQTTGITCSDTNGLTGIGLLSATGAVTMSGIINQSGVQDDNTSGSDVELTSSTVSTTRLTNASLVSVAGYVNATNGRNMILWNRTGVNITIKNDSAGTATNGIVTGTGSHVTLLNGAAIAMQYFTAINRWVIIGGVALSAAANDLTVQSKTAAYTVLNTDGLVLGDATSAAFTLTLPTAVGITGRQIKFKKIDSSANAITIDGNASETIDGATTITLDVEDETVTLISDGSNWHRF